ncbi:MAG TPA: NAD-dependent epimerase/dehydratase family protein [Candidatus Binatia bacterium]|nr:NAD-dependent epimerase/dehydratase family protein [Candidatus Binatia bacterium]
MASPELQASSPAGIVTGAGGFIGSHVVKALVERGWRVGATGHPGRPCEGVAAQQWGALNVEALASLARSLGPISAIVHCAGGSSVGPSMQDPAKDFERTVTSTLRVLEFMRAHAPEARLILLSSAAVYGAADIEPLHEELPKQPISPYGKHKAMAEDHVAQWAEQFGLSFATLRLFSVYGPGLRKQLLWELSRRALAKEAPLTLFGTGQERRDFIAVDDAVALIVRAADRALEPPIVMNGGSGRGTSVRELAEQLLGALGCEQRVRFSGAAKAGDPITMVADVRRAQAFGFAPVVSLDRGLAAYADWARREA